MGDGLNLYAYCNDNPVVYYDPSGYSKKTKSCQGKGNNKGRVNTGKYQKASLWERLTTKKVSPNELHANPLEDISNTKIGPSDTALSKHMTYISKNGTIDAPIEVQKLVSGGYEIVNGHHRWFAAKKTGLKKVPIRIKNYNN